MSKRKLGRGLSSLLAGRAEAPAAHLGLTEIPTSSIRPNRWQPRTSIPDDTLAGLAESIRRDGVLQPLVVRKLPDGNFEIVVGERRWRAARKAGMTLVPAIVRHVPDEQLLELALIENVHREDLNPIEQARAYRQLMTDLDLTQEQASKRLGQQRSTLANALRLLELPEELQGLVSRGTITAGHARAILGLPDPQSQLALAKRVIKDALSVRSTEAAVVSIVGRIPRSTRGLREKPPHIRELEDRLSQAFAARVTVQERRNGGRITIDFGSHEDLDRLLAILGLTDGEELP